MSPTSGRWAPVCSGVSTGSLKNPVTTPPPHPPLTKGTKGGMGGWRCDRVPKQIGRQPVSVGRTYPNQGVEEMAATWQTDTRTPYPRDRTIHALFEEQVARTPEAGAVTGPA